MNFKPIVCLSFDCYGTLIDWETGLAGALQPILQRHDADIPDRELLERFARAESDVQSGRFRSYREVLGEVLARLGEEIGFIPSPAERNEFAGSVALWPPFPDSTEALRRLKSRYRLIILSNIDDDLFESSARQLGVRFDKIFTAQQIGSYKPDRANFEYLLEHAGVPAERILHVAQSLYHDIVPAREIGLSTVWVNRRMGREGFGATVPAAASPDLEVPDLKTLANLALR